MATEPLIRRETAATAARHQVEPDQQPAVPLCLTPNRGSARGR